MAGMSWMPVPEPDGQPEKPTDALNGLPWVWSIQPNALSLGAQSAEMDRKPRIAGLECVRKLAGADACLPGYTRSRLPC